MAKDLKALLAKKLAENSQRHADAQQETDFDAGREHTRLDVALIDPNPYQPRKAFLQDELEMLATSIQESGLLQPVSVRQNGDRYQLIAGERRLRAHKLLGKVSIEAII
ncbi:MAG: ParB/RepB/Spo0J family partition protein, partial [Burkholderiales bacterium]|nr:ParB/RepB/Spo0J family partition protein [Burkholderiales bacterium]